MTVVEVPLADRLAALDKRQLELNALDDRLMALIAAIESALTARLSVRIAVRLDETAVLSFGKINGVKRLIVEQDGGRTALVSCSREVRARVFQERIVTQLIVDGEALLVEQIKQREQAIEAAEDLRQLLVGVNS